MLVAAMDRLELLAWAFHSVLRLVWSGIDVRALEVRLLGLQEPLPLGTVVWVERYRSPRATEPAVHKIPGDVGQVEYRIRPVEEAPTVEGEAFELDDLAPKLPPLDPITEAVRARINKLRPSTVDPDADDYDDKKWLRVGEEV